MKTNTTAYQTISEVFNLCKVPENQGDVQNLIDTLTDSIGTMAMVDYPYPTNFVEPLPAWPVNYSCSAAVNASMPATENSSIMGLAAAGSTFYNYAG